MVQSKEVKSFLDKIMPDPKDLRREYSDLTYAGQVKTFREILQDRKIGKMVKLGDFGIPALDEATGGMYEGELITISGLTKHGKTTLAQTFTRNLIKKDMTVGWFTFEVPPAQFLSVFEDDEKTLDYGLLPVEHRAGDLKWLFQRIAEMHVTWSTRIFVIDHLHFLFDLWSTRNVSLTIGQVVRALKHLAVVGGFAIILLCHYSKGQKEEADDSYENLRDSSLIAQESDTVFLIRRLQDDTGNYGNEAILSVEFHRRTSAMKKRLGLVKVRNFFFPRTLRDKEMAPRERRNYGYGND